MTIGTPTAPIFTTHPASQTVTEGHTATFTASATGNPAPTYQWQTTPDGNTWTNIQGATAPTFVRNATLAMNNSDYRCIATNSAGIDTSNVATLTVTPANPGGSTGGTTPSGGSSSGSGGGGGAPSLLYLAAAAALLLGRSRQERR